MGGGIYRSICFIPEATEQISNTFGIRDRQEKMVGTFNFCSKRSNISYTLYENQQDLDLSMILKPVRVLACSYKFQVQQCTMCHTKGSA
jgi:hypothetical protein